MLVSAVVCPHPPALVPAVSQGAAGRLDVLREASVRAVRHLQVAHPDLVVCVGAGQQTRRLGTQSGGNLRRYGADVHYGGPLDHLPLSLTIGAYLLEQAGGPACDLFQEVAETSDPDACSALGVELAGLASRVALLVLGDGSARLTRQSPGPYDVRAVDVDAAAVRALTTPDPGALLAIQPALADELWVAGRPAWQVLAGALPAGALSRSDSGWSGDLVYDEAPLGVGYAVVLLTRS